MDEAAQILELLSSAAFWEDDHFGGWSMQMAGSMSVDIGRKGSSCTWALTRPDGSRFFSAQAFPSVREAKNDLRAELERRRKALVYESIGPASVS